tara:strand:+ start:434 stop:700 length:267 start_codon:yes stop_codon:yes gene_type:complete
MGKKKRIITNLARFGKKHSNHPILKKQHANSPEVISEKKVDEKEELVVEPTPKKTLKKKAPKKITTAKKTTANKKRTAKSKSKTSKVE